MIEKVAMVVIPILPPISASKFSIKSVFFAEPTMFSFEEGKVSLHYFSITRNKRQLFWVWKDEKTGDMSFPGKHGIATLLGFVRISTTY